MKHILTTFGAAAMLAVLAACASNSSDDATSDAVAVASKSKLNEPVAEAELDPGYQKVTTPALSQNFVQRIAEKKQQAEREGKDIKLVLVGDSITHFWEGGGFGGFGGGFGGFGGFGGGFGGFGGGQRPAGQGQGGQRPVGGFGGGQRPAGQGQGGQRPVGGFGGGQRPTGQGQGGFGGGQGGMPPMGGFGGGQGGFGGGQGGMPPMGGFGGGQGGMPPMGGFGGGQGGMPPMGGFGGFGGGQGGQRPAGGGQGQGGQTSQNSWSELAVYHPLNLGFSGDRTENILHVVKNEGIFELIDPQLVTVMIGTNNFGMHESEPAATAEAIRLIVLAIKEKAPNAKILLYGIFPRGDGLGDKCAATNEIIKDFADNKTVFYEDLTPKFTDEQGNLIQGVMNFDRLHPAEPGYKIWGESIKAFADQHGIK